MKIHQEDHQELEEILSWMRLIRTPGVGPILFYRLLKQFHTAQKALGFLLNSPNPSMLFSKSPGSKEDSPMPPSMKEVITEYENHEKHGCSLLLRSHPLYPSWLKHLADAPPVLSVKGDLSLLKKPCFGIVGSRNASLSGRKISGSLAEELGKKGIVVVSGLARGIDGCAHESALSHGTIGVLPGGIDQVYPPEHAKLYNEIAKRGLLVSEMPWGVKPTGSLFPRRNRLISGMSWGILVVEGRPGSGSLITAQYATEQGRTVFAVPGSPLDGRSQGGNRLIKDGAVLVETVDDIMDHFSPHLLDKEEVRQANLPVEEEEVLEAGLALREDSAPDLYLEKEEKGSHKEGCVNKTVTETSHELEEEQLLAYLSNVPCPVEDLVAFLGKPASVVRGLLTLLELNGQVERSGDTYMLRGEN